MFRYCITKSLLVALLSAIMMVPALAQQGAQDALLDRLLERPANHPEFSRRPPTEPATVFQSFKDLLVQGFNRIIRRGAPPKPQPYTPDRSLFIHDVAALSGINLRLVMQALAQDPQQPMPIAPATDRLALALFKQWWGLARLPALQDANGDENELGCENDRIFSGRYRYACSLSHVSLARHDDVFGDASGAGAALKPVAAVNRSDLADGEGSCGEYRLILQQNEDYKGGAKDGYVDISVSLEAVVLEDPLRPGKCKAIERYWASFKTMSDEAVAQAVARFFLHGVTLTSAGEVWTEEDGNDAFLVNRVMNRDNLGERRHLSGQIRTNTHSKILGSNTEPKLSWLLREFAFLKPENGITNEPDVFGRVVPKPLVGSLAPELFSHKSSTADARDQLVKFLQERQGEIWKPHITGFSLAGIGANSQMPRDLRTFELSATRPRYGHYGKILRFDDRSESVEKSIKAIETTCNPSDQPAPVYRAPTTHRLMASSCSGCHQFLDGGSDLKAVDGDSNPVKWRPSLGFRHVGPIAVNGVYPISPYLMEIALPQRRAALSEEVLQPGCQLPH